MDQKPINPLVKHFRRPAIYFKLPSLGKFWPEGALDLPVTGEVPIYPMTTADELTLKTPDALMNGSGLISVIQSCCPNILDAWKMPSVDVDAVLIAIRIASYGQNMAVTSACPHCKEEHEYDINLANIIGQIKCPNFDNPVEYDGLKIKLHPQAYFDINRTNIAQFEEARITKILLDDNIPDEEKTDRLGESMKRILDISIDLLVKSTEYIETEDGQRVKDVGFLKEFYTNAESSVTKQIEARLAEIAKEADIPPVELNCSECQQAYQAPLEFDYARFFA